MKKLKEIISKDPYKFIFYSIGILFISIFFMAILISHGYYLRNYLFANVKDTFMDFFNSMFDTIGRRPYERGVIYPPLCYVIYLFFLRIVPTNQTFEGSPMFKTYQGSTFSFMLYFSITLLVLVWLIRSIKKGNEYEKTLFLILTLLSLPFLFEFERANIILVSLIFLMLFFKFKNSDNKILKEISLISLSVSACIKIYPAIFGLILLRERRYKDIVKVILYSIILFFLPFLLFGGFSSVGKFINNLLNTTNDFSNNVDRDKLNYTAFLNHFIKLLNLKGNIFNLISKIIYIFIILLSCINSLVTKIDWKRVLLLTLLMIGVPDISFTYTGIFLVLPLMFFLDDNKKRKIDVIYLILFILILFPNPIALIEKHSQMYYYSNLSINTTIMLSSVFIMTLLLNIDIILTTIKSNKKIKR